MIDLVLAADYPKETTFIDVGTGSGIIILSLAHELE
jgi:methylase of polypeptide subunit release factors